MPNEFIEFRQHLRPHALALHFAFMSFSFCMVNFIFEAWHRCRRRGLRRRDVKMAPTSIRAASKTWVRGILSSFPVVFSNQC